MKTLAAALAGIVLLTRLALADPPDIQPIPDWTIAEDTMLSVGVTITDPDTPTLIYWVEVDNTAINASFDEVNMEVHVSPLADWNGLAHVTVGVDDMDGSRTMDEETFALTVTPVNDCPTFITDPQSLLLIQEDVCLDVPFTQLRSFFRDVDWAHEGDELTFSSASFSAGTVETTATGWRLCAVNNYYGTGLLSLEASDGVCVIRAHVNVMVTAVNDCPVQNQPWALQQGSEDQALVVDNLLQHWSDVDGNAISYLGFTGGAPGFSATWSAQSGALTIHPPADWNGTDQLTLQVGDGNCTVTGLLDLQVAAVNDTPSLQGPTVLELTEDTPLDVAFAVTDVDGPALAVTVTSSAPELAASWQAGALSLLPVADWNGSATVTVQACDGFFGPEACDQAQVAVTVNPVNDGPVIEPLADVALDEDGSLGVEVQLSDIDSQELTVSVSSSQAELGVLWQPTQSRVLLTPAADWNGAALVTLSVDDQDGRAVAQATFQAVVNPVNDAPMLAPGQPLALDEDGQLTAPLAASDVDGPALAVTVASSAPELSASWLAGELVLQPAADWNGQATLTVRACDGADPELCVETEIPVTVNPVNDGPGIQPIADLVFAEDGQAQVSIQLSDLDSPELLVTVGTDDPNLTALWSAEESAITLSPAANWFGSALVTIQVDDLDGRAVSQATFGATITAVNDAPQLAPAQPLVLDEDGQLTLPLAASDVDGPALAVTVESSAPELSASWLAGELILQPAADWSGLATVTVTACDGANPDLCVATEIPVTVNPVNDTPVLAQIQPLVLDEDGQLALPLAASDVDGPALAVTVESSAPELSASWLAGELSLQPVANWNGTSTVTVRACDGAEPELCTVVEIPVTVNPINDGPGLQPIADVELAEDGHALVQVLLADLDSPDLLVTVGTDDANLMANWSSAASAILLTPAADWFGSSQVTIQVDDQDGRAVAQATFGATVTAVNDAPVLAQTQPQVMDEDGQLTLPLAASDVDGPALLVTVESSASELSASWLAGELSLQPAADWNGAATVTVRACDGADPELCVAREILVTVRAVNDAPVLAETRALVLEENETLTVAFPAGDVDGPALTVSVASSTQDVAASWSEGELFVQPVLDWNGAATLTVTACDGADPQLCVAVDLPVTVLPFNNDPVIQPLADVVFAEDGQLQVAVQFSDVDSPELLVTVMTDDASLAAAWSESESAITLTPAADWFGAATVTVSVDDQYGRSVTQAGFLATVTALNDAPVLPETQALETLEDVELLAAYQIRDVDGPALDVTVESSAPELAASWLPESGELRLLPAPEWSGVAVVTVTACDGAEPVACAQAQLQVSVLAVNDAPQVDPIADQYLDEDSSTWVPLVVHDVDSEDLLVSPDSDRDELEVIWDAQGSRLHLVPGADWNGTARVKINITDEARRSLGTVVFNTIVAPVNDAPLLPELAELSLDEGATLEVDYPVTDVDGPSLVVTALSDTSALSATWQPMTGHLQVSSPSDWSGVASLTILACDGDDGGEACVERQITVTVTAVNDAPEIATVADQRMAEDAVLEVPLSISDPDDGEWSVEISSDQAGLSGIWLEESGLVRLLPAPDWHGSAMLTVSVDDEAGRTVTQTQFQVSVLPVNDAPFARPCGEWTCGTVEDPVAFRQLLLNGGLMLDVADVDGNPLRLTWFVDGVEAAHHTFSAGADTLRCWSVPAPPEELIEGALTLHAELGDGSAIINPGGEDCAWELDFTSVGGLEPTRFTLGPGYPNPFNPSAHLPYQLRQAGEARLTIYDLRGAQVTVLAQGWQAAGAHEVVWNATGQASGIYLAVLEADGQRRVERLTLLK